MARRKKVSEGKKNIIKGLIEEYDIQTAEDIQDALADLLGETIGEMVEAEATEHLGYEKHERNDTDNARNGVKQKKVRSKYGEVEIDVPQDRNSSFESKIVKKRQKDISAIDDKIISMYARGMSTRQISDQIEEIYGFDVSESLVSDITDKLIPKIEEWQSRPLSSIYPIVFIDAIHYSVKDEGVVKKLAAYVVLGINDEGYKDVLGIYIGQNESSKYWLSILNGLKNRGVEDILIICADGLRGIKESISTAFPKAEYQRCIVHQVRNTLKYVGYTNKKEFAKDLRTIYPAPDEKSGHDKMLEVSKKWEKIYPNSMKETVS